MERRAKRDRRVRGNDLDGREVRPLVLGWWVVDALRVDARLVLPLVPLVARVLLRALRRDLRRRRRMGTRIVPRHFDVPQWHGYWASASGPLPRSRSYE